VLYPKKKKKKKKRRRRKKKELAATYKEMKLLFSNLNIKELAHPSFPNKFLLGYLNAGSCLKSSLISASLCCMD
jgi:hypothetical protein